MAAVQKRHNAAGVRRQIEQTVLFILGLVLAAWRASTPARCLRLIDGIRRDLVQPSRRASSSTAPPPGQTLQHRNRLIDIPTLVLQFQKDFRYIHKVVLQGKSIGRFKILRCIRQQKLFPDVNCRSVVLYQKVPIFNNNHAESLFNFSEKYQKIQECGRILVSFDLRLFQHSLLA